MGCHGWGVYGFGTKVHKVAEGLMTESDRLSSDLMETGSGRVAVGLLSRHTG